MPILLQRFYERAIHQLQKYARLHITCGEYDCKLHSAQSAHLTMERKIQWKKIHISDLHFWNDCECFEYCRADAKGHEQISDKYHTKMAGCRGHGYHDWIHPIFGQYVHSTTYVNYFVRQWIFIKTQKLFHAFHWNRMNHFQIQHFIIIMEQFMCYFTCIWPKYSTPLVFY